MQNSSQHSPQRADFELELMHRGEYFVSLCPDCHNKLFFVEAGFLCPVCGFSSEVIYS